MKVVDMHCDTITEIYQKRIKGEADSLLSNSLHIDLKRMKKSDYLLQNFAIFVQLNECENPLEYTLKVIDFYYEELKKNEQIIRPVLRYSDIVENQKLGIMSSLLAIEEGGTTLLDLGHLRNFYRLGVRMLTLTWNYYNGIGYPNLTFKKDEIPKFNAPNTESGLTTFGIEFVEEMEKLGMIIDVSHLSDAGFFDVLRYTTKPFVASHSNSRALCNHVRNLTDTMIRKIGERGGVIGINFCSSFLKEGMSKEEEEDSISFMADNIKRMIYVGGYECVGLGSDFDGITTNVGMKDCSCIHKLADRLRKEGLSQSTIESIMFRNVLKVYKEVLL